MKGFIISYKPCCKRDVVRINHHLFGKITSIGDKKYYYKGELDETNFFKICNGCYFICEDNFDRRLLKVYVAELMINDNDLKTGRQKWIEYAKSKGMKVINLND